MLEALQTKGKFSPTQIKQMGKMINAYAAAPTQKLKTQIVDMFTPQIQQKARAAAALKGISIADYTQDLYLALLENLERVANDCTYKVSMLSRVLNLITPSQDTIIQTSYESIEDITPEEEYKNLSYDSTEMTQEEKVEQILELTKHRRTEKTNYIISKFLEGIGFDGIGYMLNLSGNRTRDIYNRAMRQIKHSSKKEEINDIFYDNTQKSTRRIPADKPSVYPLFDKKNITPEMINQIAKHDIDPNNTWGKLDIMLRTQSWWKRLLYDAQEQERFKQYLQKYPDSKIYLILDRDIDKSIFIPEAEQISISKFGVNVFQFANHT